MFESKAKKIKASMIPKKWKTTDKAGGYSRSAKYDTCSYLEEFWQKRWAAPNGGVTASEYHKAGMTYCIEGCLISDATQRYF
jgi:hypothetical protein